VGLVIVKKNAVVKAAVGKNFKEKEKENG